MALSYGFDATGNLTTLPTGATATYDHNSELTSSALSGTTTSYTYSADGERLTTKQSSTTIASGTWNGARQLTAYNNSTADMTSATHDGNGIRESTTITPSGGSSVTQRYVWNMASQIPEMIMDPSNAYIYGGGESLAEQVNLSTGAPSYMLTDSIGSLRGVVTSAGALAASTSYDAWGNPDTTGGLSADTPFGYADGYTDSTGLLYLINRYYDPTTGQFISVDPDISLTHYPYAYANGNPINNYDPTGASSVHYANVYCGKMHSYSDLDGTFTYQHGCGWKTAPWGFKVSAVIRSFIVGDVNEVRMVWTRNGRFQSDGSPHPFEAKDHQFHGTFNPVHAGDNIGYTDEFVFEIDVFGRIQPDYIVIYGHIHQVN